MTKLLNRDFKLLIAVLWSGAALSVSIRSYMDGYVGFAIFNFIIMSIVAYALFRYVNMQSEITLFWTACAKRGVDISKLSDAQLVEEFRKFKNKTTI